jgi:hypothetical protein
MKSGQFPFPLESRRRRTARWKNEKEEAECNKDEEGD